MVALAGLVLAAAPAAFAAGQPATSLVARYAGKASPPAADSLPHAPVSLVETAGPGSGTNLVVGFNNLDPLQKINCPVANGCTITTAGFAALTTTVVDTLWGVCTEVDNTNIYPCWTMGNKNQVGVLSGTSRQTTTVAQGKHLVRTLIYVSQPTKLDGYQIDYTISTP